MSNLVKTITLIFSENPIARAYLLLFIKKKLTLNKIIYLNQKLIFNNFFLRLRYNIVFGKTKKYLKSKNVLIFIKNIEKHFNLDENFLIDMYNFENIFKFSNLEFARNSDINNELNFKYFQNLKEQNFLNTSNKIFKNILNSNKNFFHVHPGFMYKVRGGDGTLNSIKHYNKIGATFYLMDRKIDSGKILKRFENEFKKIYFPDNSQFNSLDLYNIWFSFFDPAVRVSFLNKILNENIQLDNFEDINLNLEENNYYPFIDKNELKSLFIDKILLSTK